MKMYMHVLYIFLFTNANTFLASASQEFNEYLRREHSISKPYQSTGISIPYWDFTGSVMITQSQIRITPDVPSKSGAIWNNVQCKVKNWELQVHFKVYGKGKTLFGDGMAIWYTKQPLTPGPVFGSMDYFSGIGIFLDTYANHNGPHDHGHPYISAMVNNGSQHYDHDRDGTHTQLAGCEAKFRNTEFETHLSVRYENYVLSVLMDIEGKSAYQECFKVEGVKIPTGYYFGASATTGDLSDNHDIISMKLYELDVPDDGIDRSDILPEAAHFSAPREHVDDPPQSMSGTKLFLITVSVLFVLCAIVIGGVWYFYPNESYSQSRRKRLY